MNAVQTYRYLQPSVLRLLWHLRTFNFHVLVRAEPVSGHEHHLAAATALFGAATPLVAA
ncbi:hypothetical protein AB0J14_38035 [Micromonospora arborensis]|uniref:hypothetical protein n=1 Tax=Micromonospora arborensis TaxID=2116518 RepID=UPI0033CB5060